MKKTYSIPNTEVLFIATSKMIAVSLTKDSNAENAVDPTADNGNILSRKGGFWDDEE